MRLLPEEDQAEYTEHCQGIVASLKPGNPLERHLAQAVADDYWRIERIRRLELTADPDAKELNLYSTYESRLNRNIKNNLAELRKLRAERLEDEFQQDRTNIMAAMRTGAPPPPPAGLSLTPNLSPPTPGSVLSHWSNGFAYAPGSFPTIKEIHEAEDELTSALQAAARRPKTGSNPPDLAEAA